MTLVYNKNYLILDHALLSLPYFSIYFLLIAIPKLNIFYLTFQMTFLLPILLYELHEIEDPDVREFLGQTPHRNEPANSPYVRRWNEKYNPRYQELKILRLQRELRARMGTTSSKPVQDETINLNVGTGDMAATTEHSFKWDQSTITTAVLIILGCMLAAFAVGYLCRRYYNNKRNKKWSGFSLPTSMPSWRPFAANILPPAHPYGYAPPPFAVQDIRPPPVAYHARDERLEPLAIAPPSAPPLPAQPAINSAAAWHNYFRT